MNDKDIAIGVVCLGAFAVLVSMSLTSVAKRKRRIEMDRRRLDLIEQALKDPSIEPATRNELLRALAADATPAGSAPACDKPGGQRDWWHALWFGIGWCLFVVGGCLMAAEGFRFVQTRDMKTTLPMTVVGFAMLTLPTALRELTRRRAIGPVER